LQLFPVRSTILRSEQDGKALSLLAWLRFHVEWNLKLADVGHKWLITAGKIDAWSAQ
jgi:hypothetical protein